MGALIWKDNIILPKMVMTGILERLEGVGGGTRRVIRFVEQTTFKCSGPGMGKNG